MTKQEEYNRVSSIMTNRKNNGLNLPALKIKADNFCLKHGSDSGLSKLILTKYNKLNKKWN